MAGEVVAAGAETSRLEVGDRVVLMSNPCCGQCPVCLRGDTNVCIGVDAPGHAGVGTYAQYVAMPESWLLKTPDSLSDEQAVTIQWAYGNSLHAVNVGGVKLGSTVAVTAASSAMGIACIQLSKRLGAKCVIGLSRSPEKAERILAAGADHVIDFTAKDALAQIQEVSGSAPLGGIDVFLDNHGSQELMDFAIETAALQGRIIIIASNLEPGVDNMQIPPRQMIRRHLTVAASRSATYEEQVQVLDLAAEGRVHMPIEEIFELENMTRAHELLDAGKHVGKIVVRA
jgi:putative oxidoreductase